MKDHTPQLIQPQLPFDEIPYGYCHCGCGKKTKIAYRSRTALGWVKGEPIPYIIGHSGFDTRSRPVEERLWERVNKNGTIHPALRTRCWLWTGGKTPFGYGKLLVNQRHMTSHRVSWILAHGEIPAGLQVLHHCDIPACVNPDHLYLGTAADNHTDMLTRNRIKLKTSDADVLEIRRLYAAGVTCRELAKRYGIHKETARDIALRRTRKQVT